jgi:ankyrin repeat protein
MEQSQSNKLDKLFTLICTDNIEELKQQLRSSSSPEQTRVLSNLTDNDKAATLLMYAAFYGNQTICQLLIESGADVFAQDDERRHFLYYAIISQTYDVVNYIIEDV